MPERREKMSEQTKFWMITLSGALAIILASSATFVFSAAADYSVLKSQVSDLMQKQIPEHMATTDESIKNIKENLESVRRGQEQQSAKLDYIIQHQNRGQ